MKSLPVALMIASASAWASAQSGVPPVQSAGQPLGTVSISDAAVVSPVAAPVTASQSRAPVIAGTVVTANPGHNADVALTRGGSVLVCQTSSLHVAGSIPGPLLLALDRGAMEIRMKSAGDDSLITPDLRITMPSGGTLDLRIRVSFNGDTCVENRGRGAPTLRLTDAFGDTSYEVKPGQHVLFEHGSLREVVDRETTPCGCPPAAPTGVSIAEAALYGGRTKVSPQQAEAAHPFPAAVSEGLAATPPIPPEQPAGGTHVQVATALTYNPADPVKSVPPIAEPAALSQSPPPASQAHHSPIRAFFRGIKRFFSGG